MIYHLEIENFYCFRDPQIIDVRLARGVADESKRFFPIYHGARERAPAVVTLFGANASGKSSVLKALSFFKEFVVNSTRFAGFPLEPFNSADMSNKPIRLAIEFGTALGDAASQAEEPRFGVMRYELEFGVEDGIIKSIQREELREKGHDASHWVRVFKRSVDKVADSSGFRLGRLRGALKGLRPHVSLISFLANLQHERAVAMVQSIGRVQTNIHGDRLEISDQMAWKYLQQNPSVLNALNRELNRLDVGIDKLEILSMPQGPVPAFNHFGFRQPQLWQLESTGTREFIKIFPLLYVALVQRSAVFADEMDTALHPFIIPEVLRWFYDPERNPGNAQLWASVQQVTLLDELEKEQILFCEKARDGAASVYALVDFKGARREDNFLKKYLGGAYGAVPVIG